MIYKSIPIDILFFHPLYIYTNDKQMITCAALNIRILSEAAKNSQHFLKKICSKTFFFKYRSFSIWKILKKILQKDFSIKKASLFKKNYKKILSLLIAIKIYFRDDKKKRLRIISKGEKLVPINLRDFFLNRKKAKRNLQWFSVIQNFTCIQKCWNKIANEPQRKRNEENNPISWPTSP